MENGGQGCDPKSDVKQSFLLFFSDIHLNPMPYRHPHTYIYPEYRGASIYRRLKQINGNAILRVYTIVIFYILKRGVNAIGSR